MRRGVTEHTCIDGGRGGGKGEGLWRGAKAIRPRPGYAHSSASRIPVLVLLPHLPKAMHAASLTGQPMSLKQTMSAWSKASTWGATEGRSTWRAGGTGGRGYTCRFSR